VHSAPQHPLPPPRLLADNQDKKKKISIASRSQADAQGCGLLFAGYYVQGLIESLAIYFYFYLYFFFVYLFPKPTTSPSLLISSPFFLCYRMSTGLDTIMGFRKQLSATVKGKNVSLFEIRLENDFIVFRGHESESAGQVVRGVVVLCTSSPMKVEDVHLRLSGTLRHKYAVLTTLDE
jgi:hypothetical protein